MHTFKVGDKVRVRRPINREQPPVWTCYMDRYHDTIQYIRNMSAYVYMHELGDVAFHTDWLTLVPEVPEKPLVDWSKPVRFVGNKETCRVLCVNAPAPRSVVVLTLDGTVFTVPGDTSIVENVPVEPMRDTRILALWQNGTVTLVSRGMTLAQARDTHKTYGSSLIGLKEVTITEGDGLA